MNRFMVIFEPKNMKSFTIHNLEAELYDQLKNEAESLGLSLNKLVKKILQKKYNPANRPKKKRDLSFMVTPMDKSELASFNESLQLFDTIDSEEW